METRTELAGIRRRRGIAASDLAKRAGVSRQTIYAIEAGDYIPNTTLALQLARILEVRVEDLFSLHAPAPLAPPMRVDFVDGDGSVAPGQPVQLCKVGKRIIGVGAVPQSLTLPAADGIVVDKSKVRVFSDGVEEEKQLLIAGCDPGISLLMQHLARFEGVEIVLAPCSSRKALEWLKDRKVHMAGSHLRDLATGEYNLPVIGRLFPRREVKVVTFAIWEQGLVTAAQNPLEIRSAADLVRKNVRFINREKGAGSRELLDEYLKAAGIPAERVNGYERIAYGHLPAALAVSLGEADCCIASHSAARAFGLNFIPLATERFDLVIRHEQARLPAVEILLDVLNRAAIRRKLEMLAGYDTSHTGEVLVA